MSHAHKQLQVAVIGGGIAGLAAAAFLRPHTQYTVTVYERRNAEYNETSAAIGIRTNGISISKQLGITREEIRAVVGAGYRTYNISEDQVSKSSLDDGPDGDGALWLVFRQDFKDALLRRVTCQEGAGNSIDIVYGCHVVGVDPEAGAIFFGDGSSSKADLIIGADGINSKIRAAVIPASHPAPIASGLSVYRFVLPMDAVKDAIGASGALPEMLNYDQGTYVAIIAAGDMGNRNIVLYPCRGHEQMNCAFAIPDSIIRDPTKLQYSWSVKGSVDDMIEFMEGFPAWLKRVFRRTPQVELFQVRDQEPLPTYVKARTVLIGDAAHAMVPYQGQGANQALEDVEGLKVLLGRVSSRDGIPDALLTWDSIRRPRASEIQKGSRASQASISSKTASEAILSVKPYVSMKEALVQLQLPSDSGESAGQM